MQKNRHETQTVSSSPVTVGPLKVRVAVPKADLVPSTTNAQKKALDGKAINAILNNTAEKMNDSTGIRELLPDVNLVVEVLVASILSPKDLNSVGLQVRTANAAIPGLGEIVRRHLTEGFDLEERLPTILEEALFDSGSYTLMPLPASAIHRLIAENSIAVESISDVNIGNIGNRTTGYLGGTADHSNCLLPAISMEAADASEALVRTRSRECMTVTDNITVLLKPTVERAGRHDRAETLAIEAYGMENLSMGANAKDPVATYLKRRFKTRPMLDIRDDDDSLVLAPGQKELTKEQAKAKKVNAGKASELLNDVPPVVLYIPAEAIVPVHVPGEPSNHVGYYIAVDKNGHPISRAKDTNYFKDLNDRLEKASSGSDKLVSMLTGGMTGSQDNAEKLSATALVREYEKQLERELALAVKNGNHADSVEISKPTEFYRTMFARQLAQTKTEFVYVPASMLTYFAFDYNSIGVGQSLIEKTKLFASLRAILMFSNIMAGIKNSVPGRILDITLDDADMDPQNTVETLLTEFMAMQTTGLPLGRLQPGDIIESLERSGVQVKINGGEIFPSTTLEVEDVSRDVPKPDSDLSDELKRMHYAGMGVSPENIDKSQESEFATGIASENLLQAKRIMVYQHDYTSMLSDFTRKYIYAGGPLLTEIKAAYNEAKIKESEYTLSDIIESINIVLPEPDSSVTKAQYEAYSSYEEFVDKAVEVYVTEDSVGDMSDGEWVIGAIDNVRMTVRNHLLRAYLRKHNMVPDLELFFSDTEVNHVDSIVDLNDSIMEVTREIMSKLLKKERKEDDKINKVKEKLDEEPEEEEEVLGDDSADGTDSDAGDTDTDDLGGDDTGDDVGDDEPADLGDETGGDADAGSDTDNGLDPDGFA